MIFRVCTFLIAAAILPAQIIPSYSGPVFGGRSIRDAGNRGEDPLNIRPYVNVQAVADAGALAAGIQNGQVANAGNLYGVEANVGAYGTKAWKKDRLGLDYIGTFRYYNKSGYFSGTDHLLNLEWNHQVSRRFSLIFRTAAGTSSRAGGGFFSLNNIDASYLGVPLIDLFDNRTYFAEVSGASTIALGNKSGLSIGGSGYAVRRQSKALVGMNGQRAFADFSRKISRNTSLGVSYQYFHVDYPRAFGESDVHTVLLNYTRSIGRRWRFKVGGGVFHTDLAGTRTVTLDPVIQELLGIKVGREAFNTINWSPSLLVSISRQFRRSGFDTTIQRAANPGNGVLLLNRTDGLTSTYRWNMGQKWSLSASANVYRSKGFGVYQDTFNNYGGGFQANYRFFSDLHFTMGVDTRHYSVNKNTFSRTGTRVSAGFTYSPGSFPFMIR